MGVKNDKIYNEIPSNDELNDKIRKKKINEIKNPEEIKKFNGLINDNIQKNIKRSDFKTNFENKVYEKAVHLLNIIYIENTNLFLSTIDYRTMYGTIFNYDIIEKKGDKFGKNNKKILPGDNSDNINSNKIIKIVKPKKKARSVSKKT